MTFDNLTAFHGRPPCLTGLISSYADSQIWHLSFAAVMNSYSSARAISWPLSSRIDEQTWLIPPCKQPSDTYLRLLKSHTNVWYCPLTRCWAEVWRLSALFLWHFNEKLEVVWCPKKRWEYLVILNLSCNEAAECWSTAGLIIVLTAVLIEFYWLPILSWRNIRIIPYSDL